MKLKDNQDGKEYLAYYALDRDGVYIRLEGKNPLSPILFISQKEITEGKYQLIHEHDNTED